MRRLLIRPGAIGDFIVSLPALEFLQARYIEVWCAEQNVPLARFCNQALSIVSSGLDRVGILPAPDALQRLSEFDEIHSWYGAQRPDFRAAVAGLPFSFYDAIPPAGGVGATAFYCTQVGAPVALPRIPVTAVRENFAVFHPFASNPAKRWPLTRFRELAVCLENVQWCAGPEEALDGAVRIPNLWDLAQWLARAGIFIGNDSGITHLAAAVGTPTVAIFGPTDPAVWAPRGPFVRVIHRSPIDSIPVADVLAAVKSLL